MGWIKGLCMQGVYRDDTKTVGREDTRMTNEEWEREERHKFYADLANDLADERRRKLSWEDTAESEDAAEGIV